MPRRCTPCELAPTLQRSGDLHHVEVRSARAGSR